MEKKNNSLIVQGAILALAGIITKIIGFIYRIPMANMLGEEGNGIYSVAFGIYNVALTLSSYSLPLALSKLMSERLASKSPKNAFVLFKRALVFALIAGATAFSVLFFGAEFLEALYGRTGLMYPLRVLAPTTFIVALLGVFRGYFQGHSNMVPTALSQIIEQIINAGVSIFATWLFMKSFGSSAIGAAGATMGTLAGAFGALIMLSLFFASRMRALKSEIENDTSDTERKRVTYRGIVLTMIPIILSQTVFQISFTADDLLFGNILIDKGFEESVISSLQGVFNTQYTGLVNLPIAIATALASATLPAIVNLHIKEKKEEKHKKTDSVIKLTMAITIPSAVGLAVLSRPIMTLLFPNLVTYREIAVDLLEFGSVGCIFYSISIITTSVLQGNGRMKDPVKNAFVSFIFHIALFFSLLKFTNLGIYARLIADVT
ncbi:MAG: polysaccharide biosynthesis protein, partial [Clostridia bacterium]|nr:polysaccharide biosynthesis protein [Clostridia bacterium]